jgi:hypothetical protein
MARRHKGVRWISGVRRKPLDNRGFLERQRAREAGFTWRAPLCGNATAVDHTTGMLSLNTHEGELKLHFPPACVFR